MLFPSYNSTSADRRGRVFEVLGPVVIGIVLTLFGVLVILAGREVYQSEILGTYVPGNVTAPISDRGAAVIGFGVAFALVGLFYFCVVAYITFAERSDRDRLAKNMELRAFK